MKSITRYALTCFFCVAAANALAAPPTFQISQIYSNADGSIQFIQLREVQGLDEQHHFAGLTLRSTHNGIAKEFVFPADLPSHMTANEWLLIATTDCVPFYGDPLEAIYEWNCLAPDLRIPERFLPTDGGTIDFAGVDQVSYASLPIDGATALDRNGNAVSGKARPFQTPRVIVAYESDYNHPIWLSTPISVTSTDVTATEFYAATLDHYFITAFAPDLEAIASGRISGWVPTGKTVPVWPSSPFFSYLPFDIPVCRFYIPPSEGDSHFFAASPEECAAVMTLYPEFILETRAAFYVQRPISETGACPIGRPVYRLWNGRADTNHRYTTERAVRDQMVARGWIPEGYGPDAVVFCSS